MCPDAFAAVETDDVERTLFTVVSITVPFVRHIRTRTSVSTRSPSSALPRDRGRAPIPRTRTDRWDVS